MPKSQKSKLFKVVQSTLAGLFGIQSEKNREEDFKTSSAGNFIIGAIIGVILLLGGMALLVSAVLSNTP